MKKKILFVPFVFLVVISLLIVGCSSPTPTPSGPSPTPTPPTPAPGSPTPAPPEEDVIEITFAYYMPPPQPGVFGMPQGLQNWADRIEKETNGRVKITFYPAGSLLKNEDSYQGVVDGVADMTHWSPHVDPATFELFQIFLLPGLKWPKPENKYWLMREIFADFPELGEEFKGVEILSFNFTSAPLLSFAKDQVVRTPADVKGMKIGTGALYAPYIEAFGAAPVVGSPADRYLSLEKGVIDGQILPWAGIKAFRTYEVTKSYTDPVGLHEAIAVEIMNKDVWDSLPLDIQEIFLKWNDYLGFEATRGAYYEDSLGRNLALEYGGNIYTPTAEEFKLWADALAPIRDSWVQEKEAEGLQVRPILDELMRLIDKYNE